MNEQSPDNSITSDASPADHASSVRDQRELLARFKTDAWPLLPSLLRTAMMLTHNPHDAEDLVQETMLRAYRHIDSFQTGTNMHAWLITILRRLHIDTHRANTRRVSTQSLDALSRDPVDTNSESTLTQSDETDWKNPDELMNRFDNDTIASALRALPESMRWVLLLVDVEQLSVADAAHILDIPQGTVKSRASRARVQLRQYLLPIAQQHGWVPAASGE